MRETTDVIIAAHKVAEALQSAHTDQDWKEAQAEVLRAKQMAQELQRKGTEDESNGRSMLSRGLEELETAKIMLERGMFNVLTAQRMLKRANKHQDTADRILGASRGYIPGHGEGWNGVQTNDISNTKWTFQHCFGETD